MVSPIAPRPLTPTPGRFVNSVAIGADGGRIAAGSCFHDCSSTANTSRRWSAPTTDGHWGEYGRFVWQADGTPLCTDVFEGWERVAMDADGRALFPGLSD